MKNIYIYNFFIFTANPFELMWWPTSFQDDFEIHHVGLKTPHIHNLSDMVQGILALQVIY